MVWTPEPTYEKPEISVRATTLYYQIVAPILLPFLDRRLLNLFRCRGGKCFFQRNREHPPTGTELDGKVHFEPVQQKNGRTEQYLYVETTEEIVACAKVQTVEIHGWGSRAGEVETPDRLVIDLDPDPKLGFDKVKQAAFQVQRAFEAVGLESFALLSGGKGIHVVVPLEPLAEWDEVDGFAKSFCTALADAAPDKFTVALPKPQRRGRIFLDFLRNHRTATAIMPWSARARAGMPVAAPVTWQELPDIDRSDAFTVADVEALVKRARSRALKKWGAGPQRLPRLAEKSGRSKAAASVNRRLRYLRSRSLLLRELLRFDELLLRSPPWLPPWLRLWLLLLRSLSFCMARSFHFRSQYVGDEE